MEDKEWKFEDKSEWGEGLWQDEPDKAQWTDSTTGYPCLALRSYFGSWCGYVGINEDHPLYGIGYRTCSVNCGEEDCLHRPVAMLDVHGQISYSAFPQVDAEDGLRYVVSEEEDASERYWIGFDCGHAGDFMPREGRRFKHGIKDFLTLSNMLTESAVFCPTYKPLSYVKQECADLAAQLLELKKAKEAESSLGAI